MLIILKLSNSLLEKVSQIFYTYFKAPQTRSHSLYFLNIIKQDMLLFAARSYRILSIRLWTYQTQDSKLKFIANLCFENCHNSMNLKIWKFWFLESFSKRKIHFNIPEKSLWIICSVFGQHIFLKIFFKILIFCIILSFCKIVAKFCRLVVFYQFKNMQDSILIFSLLA